MKTTITIFNEKGIGKLKFTPTNNIVLTYGSNPLYVFDHPFYSRKLWESVEIKTLVAPAEYDRYYELITFSEKLRLKVNGMLSYNVTGYFERLDTQIEFDGTYKLTLSFRPFEVSDMYVMDPFEVAMVTAKTTNAAIEAAIRIIGK